jgi:hypothetical protein
LGPAANDLIANISFQSKLGAVRLSPSAKRSLLHLGHALLDVWLIVALLAYFGALELSGVLADLAMVTVIAIIAQMIWKYALRPLFGTGRGA